MISSAMAVNLSGQSALVTGASSGIGGGGRAWQRRARLGESPDEASADAAAGCLAH